MKPAHLAILSLFFTLAACSSNQSKQTAPHGELQAISAQGDSLYAPTLDEKSHKKFERRQQAAHSNYKDHPDSIKAIIGYGQATKKMGHYRQAIDFYSRMIDSHESSAQLLLQRGQLYIITRKFNHAVSDLQEAADLIADQKTSKTPSAKTKKSTMLPSDIHQSLGLAQYLNGDFDRASRAFRQARKTAPADPMRVETAYWLYMSMRRAGKDLEAGKVLEPIKDEMNLNEHETYHKLLLVFKGDFKEKALLNEAKSRADSTAIDYGLGNWHYINGRKQHARRLFKEAVASDNWADDSYIAAETDLARLDL